MTHPEDEGLPEGRPDFIEPALANPELLDADLISFSSVELGAPSTAPVAFLPPTTAAELEPLAPPAPPSPPTSDADVSLPPMAVPLPANATPRPAKKRKKHSFPRPPVPRPPEGPKEPPRPAAYFLAVGPAYTLGWLHLSFGILALFQGAGQLGGTFLLFAVCGALSVAGASILYRKKTIWPLILAHLAMAGVWIGFLATSTPRDREAAGFWVTVVTIALLSLAGVVAALSPSVRKWTKQSPYPDNETTGP